MAEYDFTKELTIEDYLSVQQRGMRQKGESLITFPDSFVVADLETTGFDPFKDEILEISALKVENGIVIDTFSSLVNPGTEIPAHISRLTGITNEMAADAPTIESVMPEFLRFVGDYLIVGHNVCFDINFITEKSFDSVGKWFYNDFVDTLRIARYCTLPVGSYKLTALSDYYGIEQKQAHRALADCYTTMELFYRLKQTYHDAYDPIVDVDTLVIPPDNPFSGKKVREYGSFTLLKGISDRIYKLANAEYAWFWNEKADYIIFGKHVYLESLNGIQSEQFQNDLNRHIKKTTKIISECEFCRMLGIEVPDRLAYDKDASAPAESDAQDDFSCVDPSNPFYGKTCVFTGTLERFTRKSAETAVTHLGGKVTNSVTSNTSYLILGNNDYNPFIKDGKSTKQRKAEELLEKGSDIIILSENVFYDLLESCNYVPKAE